MTKLAAATRIAAVLALTALLLPAEGQAVPFSSSMSAKCVAAGGTSCARVRFVLSFTGNYGIRDLSIQNQFGVTGWAFKTWGTRNHSATGGTLDGEFANELSFKWDPAYTTGSPVYIFADLSTYGTEAELVSGNTMGYYGDAFTPLGCDDVNTDCQPDKGESFYGTVTPEPITVTLLLSGLAGVAGVARRRRKDDLG